MWSAWLNFLLIGRDHSAGERKEYVPRKLRSDEEALRWRGKLCRSLYDDFESYLRFQPA